MTQAKTSIERQREINQLIKDYYRTGNASTLQKAQALMTDHTGEFASLKGTNMRDILKHATLNDAEYMHNQGRITDAEFDEYCYFWRDGVYRYSLEGKHAATRHANTHGLPMAYSDRELETK